MLPRDISQWPEDWRYRYWEREAIMIESGVTDAARKAEADVRRAAERE